MENASFAAPVISYLTFSVNCYYLLLKRTTSGLVPSFLAKVPFSKGTGINEELCYVVMLQYVRLTICHALINAGLFQILWLLNYCIFLKEGKCTKQFVCFQFISLKRKKKKKYCFPGGLGVNGFLVCLFF